MFRLRKKYFLSILTIFKFVFGILLKYNFEQFVNYVLMSYFKLFHNLVLYLMFKIMKIFVILIAASLIAMFCLFFTILWKYSPELPSYNEILEYKTSTFFKSLYSSDGILLKYYHQQERIFVPIERMPNNLINAFIILQKIKNFILILELILWQLLELLLTIF